MRPRLKLRPALECAAPEKAELIVVKQLLLRWVSGAGANGAGSRMNTEHIHHVD